MSARVGAAPALRAVARSEVAVVTFLALLELLNEQAISLIQGEGINNFWLTLGEE